MPPAANFIDFGSHQIVRIPRSKLILDHRYQRTKIRWEWIHDKASHFRKDLFRALDVALQSDGSYAVIDGQHRLYLLDRLAEDARVSGRLSANADFLVPCVIHEQGYSEAETFVGLNDNNPLTILEKLKARYQANDSVAVGLVQTCHSMQLGFRFAPHEGANLTSIAALENTYNEDPERLRWVLWVLSAAWTIHDAGAFTSAIIRGLARFWVYAAMEGIEVDTERMTAGLRTTTPTKLIELGRKEYAASLDAGVALALVDLYNGKQRTGRVPRWGKEELKSLSARLANLALTPEERSARAVAASATRSPEERSSASRKGWDNLSPEEREARAAKGTQVLRRNRGIA